MTQENLLVPNNTYLKHGSHIGTNTKTEYMSKFIYKTRPDGLSILNIERIDQRLRKAAKFLSLYDPEDILVVCRRENGWPPVEKFKEIIGVKTITGRYPPGTLTDPTLDNFMEPEVILITDPVPDENAMMDAYKAGIPVVALCDSNNQTNYLDLAVPANNKGTKPLALIYYLLANEYLKNRGMLEEDEDIEQDPEDFIE